jgi:hypothetical protein
MKNMWSFYIIMRVFFLFLALMQLDYREKVKLSTFSRIQNMCLNHILR